MPTSSAPWSTQVASDVIRDGLGVELLDGQGQVVAEVFRCDADHTVGVSLFVEQVPLHAVEMLLLRAKERLDPFGDGTPLAYSKRDA
jgi:hypothetical protein